MSVPAHKQTVEYLYGLERGKHLVKSEINEIIRDWREHEEMRDLIDLLREIENVVNRQY